MNRLGESQALKLAPYQIVQATVAEGGMERVVLNIKNQQMNAGTKVPLKTGQKLNLQVMATSPKLHLRIMEEAELRHLFRLLHSFGNGMDLTSLLENMTRGLKNVLPGQQEAAAGLMHMLGSDPAMVSGKDLSRLWQNLGLNFEALLAQGNLKEAFSGFKAMLLMYSGNLAGAGGDDAAGILDHLNLFQLCRYRLAQENTVFLPLPFDFVDQGYVLAEKQENHQSNDDPEDGKNRGADDGRQNQETWRMNINLKLSNLGNLEIRLLFEGLELRMRVLCENQKTTQTVTAGMDRLAHRLSTVSLQGWSVDTGARDPVMTLLERLVPEGNHFMEARA
jgi:hypothetical protein